MDSRNPPRKNGYKALIDQPLSSFSLPTIEVRNSWVAYINRLKKLRNKPPKHWKRVLDTLRDGGYLMEPEYKRKSYLLFNKNNEFIGSIRPKTIEELHDAGLLASDDDIVVVTPLYGSRKNGYKAVIEGDLAMTVDGRDIPLRRNTSGHLIELAQPILEVFPKRVGKWSYTLKIVPESLEDWDGDLQDSFKVIVSYNGEPLRWNQRDIGGQFFEDLAGLTEDNGTYGFLFLTEGFMDDDNDEFAEEIEQIKKNKIRMEKWFRENQTKRNNPSQRRKGIKVHPLSSSPISLESIKEMEKAFKNWHWGINPTELLEISPPSILHDPADIEAWDYIRFVEIGKLVDLHIDRPEYEESNEKFILEIVEPAINDNFIFFDMDHPKERIYFELDKNTKEDVQHLFDHLDDELIPLVELAAKVGGHHKTEGYPNIMVKPFGYLTHLSYYTHKKGDDDGIGSGYIHEMGEEGGVLPIIAFSEDGSIWMVGGDYTCPNAGITN